MLDFNLIDKSFRIIKIMKNKNNNLQYVLNKKFLPILNKKQLDIVAEKFLKDFYPSALNGEYININKLLDNIGLSINYKRLSLDKSIFGLICFENIYVKYYDNNQEKEEFAKKGTIYIDYDATCNYAGNYTTNFAIVHECVHWYLHRKYFAFLNTNEQIIKCYNDYSYDKSDIN